MSDEKALVSVEQKTVLFYEDEIVAILAWEGDKQQVFIPIRPLCDLLGVAWRGQNLRIKRDPVLSEVVRSGIVTIPEVGRREMICLPLDYLNGWLFGINATRVKGEIKDRLIRYQRECYQVLYEAFQEGRLTVDPEFSELIEGDSPAAQAYKMAQAVMNLARHQLILESRVDNLEGRLELIESQLGDESRNISQDQASQISQAVKVIAMEISRRSGQNEYGAVFGQMYRKFGIVSYKRLAANRFDECIRWLTEWYNQLMGDDKVPF